jgi:hypothetical protein
MPSCTMPHGVYSGIDPANVPHNLWKVVIRYDCCHGFSQVDNYDLRGRKVKRALDLAFDSALTYPD